MSRRFSSLLAGALLLPALAAAQLVRVANSTITLPADLPAATGYVTENALGALTFSSPIKVAALPGVTNRLFVVQRNAGIQLVNLDTMTQSTFLNLSAYLTAQGVALATDGECGLLSVAFHPNYNQNGYFYVFYSVNISSQRHERVARFQAAGTAGNFNAATTANTATHLPLITQRDEASNHNGGDLAFGPDGYLYVSLGDEGNQDDQFDNGRRIARDFFSAILRLDVDLNAANLTPNAHTQANSTGVPSAVNPGSYKVPADNPFVNLAADGSGNSTYNGYTFPGSAVRTEIWATGFRNPFRMNFDAPTGRLFVGDVGQNTYEEVDIVTAGFNGGWSWREGLHPHPPFNAPSAEPPGYAPNPPIYEYTHGTGALQGNAVIGGIVYRGTKFSELYGAYLFSDNGTSNIWTLTPATPTWTCTRIATDSGIVAIGTDPRNGDALFCSFGNSQVRRLARSGTTGTAPPALLSQTGIFSNLATLTPNAGVVPYDPNVTFWSDYAVKSRWFALKNLADTVGFSADGNWTLPTGMVWVKHFDFDTTRGVSATRRKLETRLLVKTATDVYGLSYKWRADQSDADLVAEDGLSETVAGSSPAQTWRYPSRSECRICHTPVAGFALSFNTRQLNRAHPYGAQSQNQIAALAGAGYFTALVTGINTLPALTSDSDLPARSRESRVRSYLAANCVQCHQPGGASVGNWDARPTTPTDSAALINGALVNNLGDPALRWAVSGDTAHSMILKRLQGNGVNRMPPLATSERDLVAEQLITDWITLDLPARQNFTEWQLAKFGTTTGNGAATADPDGDGDSNLREFLLRTEPQTANPPFALALQIAGGSYRLDFPQAANRALVIESSIDLQTWSPWNVPGNAPAFFATPQTRFLLGPIDTPNRFFRARLTAP